MDGLTADSLFVNIIEKWQEGQIDHKISCANNVRMFENGHQKKILTFRTVCNVVESRLTVGDAGADISTCPIVRKQQTL